MDTFISIFVFNSKPQSQIFATKNFNDLAKYLQDLVLVMRNDLVLNLRSVVFVSFSSRMPWLSARLRLAHRHPDVDTERRIPVIAKKSQATAGMARIPRSRLEEYGRVIKKRAQERLASSASAAAAQPSGERTKYSNNGSFRIMRRGDEVFGRGFQSQL